MHLVPIRCMEVNCNLLKVKIPQGIAQPTSCYIFCASDHYHTNIEQLSWCFVPSVEENMLCHNNIVYHLGTHLTKKSNQQVIDVSTTVIIENLTAIITKITVSLS